MATKEETDGKEFMVETGNGMRRNRGSNWERTYIWKVQGSISRATWDVIFGRNWERIFRIIWERKVKEPKK